MKLFGSLLLCVAALATPALAGDAKKDIVDTAVAAGSFNTLAAALTEAELIDALKSEGPFTVFAPTDDAFAKLPEGTVESLLEPENREQLIAILTYHVVPGRMPAKGVLNSTGAVTLQGQRLAFSTEDGVSIDNAQVVTADVEATNGIIHVIDTVLLPEQADLAGVATEAGSFNTLIAAAKAAGLVPALTGEGPLTILAPTDEAFAQLPEGTVEALLKPESKDKLTAILTFHVIPGRVYSTDALKAKTARTLEGSPVKFSTDDRGAKVENARLVATDIDASNGVIHVIDTVLMPPRDSADGR